MAGTDVVTVTGGIVFDETTNDLNLEVTDQTVGTGTLTVTDLAGATRTIATTSDISTNNDAVVLVDGTNPLTANWDAGAFDITASTFIGDLTGDVTGNASTATALATARNINGTSFDGTSNITVTAAAGTLTGTSLNATVVNSSLTSVGTLTSLDVSGATTLDGNVNLGDAGTDVVTVTGGIVFDETTNDLNLEVTDQTVGTGTLTVPDLAGATRTIATTSDISTNNDAVVLVDGTNPLTANWDAGAFDITASTFIGDLTGDVTGNASTATALATARTINGTSFDGTSNITVTAAAGTLTGTSLNATVVNSSLTSVGTLTSLDVSGATTLDGNVNLGDAGTDVVTVTGGIVFDETTNDLNLEVTDQTVGTGTLTVPDLAGATRTIATTSDISTNNDAVVLVDGTNPLTANWDAGAFDITASTFIGDLTGDVTGNASTATALATARTINGTSFDGTSNITVTAAAGTLTGTSLNATVVNSSLTSVGTLTSLDVSGATTLDGNVNLGDAGTDVVTVTGGIVFDETTNDLNLEVTDQTVGTGTLTVPDLAGATRTIATTSDISTNNDAVVLVDGTNPLTANWDAGAFDITASTFIGDLTGDVTGNASTATALATARTINGTSFDGTSNITVTAAAGTLTGTSLNATVVNSSLTSVGTLTSLDVSGATTLDGNVNLGDAGTDVVTVTGGIVFDETTNDLNLEVTDQTVGTGTLTVPDLAGATRTIATTSDISTNNDAVVLVDGTNPLTANWDAGAFDITASTFIGDLTGDVTGNASTATALATARTINGTSFDGTSNITVTAAAGTLTGTSLNATVVNSSLTSVGTLTSLDVSGATTLSGTNGLKFGAAGQNVNAISTETDLDEGSGALNTVIPTQLAVKSYVDNVISGVTSYTFSTGITNNANTVTSDLSTGVSGGQTVVGGVDAGDDLTLSSTSNATKGSIIMGSSAYDEVNNRLGIGTTTPSTALEVNGNISSNGSITSSSSSAGMGYSTGAGGSIIQNNSKSDPVTINNISGQIITNNAVMGNNSQVSFTVTNSRVEATDVPVIALSSGASLDYIISVTNVSDGSFDILIINTENSSAGDSLVINFAIIKAANN